MTGLARWSITIASPGWRRANASSDWPVLRLATDYTAWVDASEALLAHLDPARRDAVFGGNAMRFYGIARTAAA